MAKLARENQRRTLDESCAIMDKDKARRRSGPPTIATKILALLLVMYFAECASGSCLSYGHSCWGAHGKRSGKVPASTPDWYISRLLRRMANAEEMNRAPPAASKDDDLNAIFQVDVPDDSSTNRMSGDDTPMELGSRGVLDAKPMLDDQLLSKLKIWQIMREIPDEK